MIAFKAHSYNSRPNLIQLHCNDHALPQHPIYWADKSIWTPLLGTRCSTPHHPDFKILKPHCCALRRFHRLDDSLRSHSPAPVSVSHLLSRRCDRPCSESTPWQSQTLHPSSPPKRYSGCPKFPCCKNSPIHRRDTILLRDSSHKFRTSLEFSGFPRNTSSRSCSNSKCCKCNA